MTLQPLLHELRLSRGCSEFVLGKSKAFVAGQGLSIATEHLESELAATARAGKVLCRVKQGLSNALGAQDLLAGCKESLECPSYEVALRFCLSYPQVSTTIAGMLTLAEVARNVVASEAGPLSLESCEHIEATHKTRQFLLS